MENILLSSQTHITESFATTVGFFDGVHCGHRFLIDQLRSEAKKHGLKSMVITFDRHPRQVLHADWEPLLLTTLEEKRQLLEATGIDCLTLLPFTVEMAQLTARQFLQDVLARQLGVKLLLTGYDNHFGHRSANSSEGFSQYERYGREAGISVVEAKPLAAPLDFAPNSNVSSSLVRRLLNEGLVEQAATCLGREYSICGTVEHGHEQGRLLGFPTANLNVEPHTRLVPRGGVYAVRVRVPDSSHYLPAVTNIGTRPTFGSSQQQTVETYIHNYSANLYGQPLTISFVARLRSEKQFGSTEELAQQMALDVEKSRHFFIEKP
jgi:riboflavin kinase/FMN adenylyltransferase